MAIHARDYEFDHAEHGRGPAVVFVHGSFGDRRVWDAQLATIGCRYRAIAFSRRFHWPNAPIPAGADYSMADHIEDLDAIIEALDVGPVHLVGHSYGALVATMLAMRRRRRIHSLVLIEPPALTLFTRDPPRPLELLRLLLRRPRTALAIGKLGATGLGPAAAAARRGDADGAVARMGRAVLGPEAFAALSPARVAQARDNFIAAELLGSGFLPLAEAEVRAVDCSVLLVTGSRSPAVFHRFADRLGELWPFAERADIAGASHAVHQDNPRAFDATLLSFLDRRA